MEAFEHTINKLQQTFIQRMDEYQGELQTVTPTTISGLTADFAAFRAFIMTALQSLQEQVRFLAQQADVMEMRSRRKILLLRGVSEQENEDTAAAIVKVITSHLKMSDFSTADITRCHRMGRPGSSDKARPILFKLRDLQTRSKIWSAKTNLKRTGITLSEFLTKPRHETFMAARQKFGLSRTWSKDGFIFILGNGDVRHRISTISELDKIAAPAAPKRAATAKETATKAKRTGAASKK